MARRAANGLHFNVDVAGHGPALVLLHGFGGSAATWAPHVAIFQRRFQTVAIDLLGHGGSDAPADPARYPMAACAEDVLALLDGLGLAQVSLLGYSMGGRVALYLAATCPRRVRALILESASPGLAEPAERQARVASDEALAQMLEQQGLEIFFDAWARQPLFASQAHLPEPARAELRAQRLRNNPTGLAGSLRGLGTGSAPDVWARLGEVTMPTLVLAGALDEKYARLAREMSARLPQAQLALVPEAGHTVHLEQPEAFDRLVLEFLSDQR